MIIVMGAQSQIAYRWFLVVALNLLLTAKTLSVPAPLPTIELPDISEVTVAANSASTPTLLSLSVASVKTPLVTDREAVAALQTPVATTSPLALTEAVDSSPSLAVERAEADEGSATAAPLPENVVEAASPSSSVGEAASSDTTVAGVTVALVDNARTPLLTTTSRAAETSQAKSVSAMSDTLPAIAALYSLTSFTPSKAIKSESDSSSTVASATIASSNAPATTTTNEGEELHRKQDTLTIVQHSSDSEYNGKEKEDTKEKQEITYSANEQQQSKNVKGTTEKSQQIATLEHQQQKPTLTTDMPRQKETDMHTQVTGNADINPTASIIVADNTHSILTATMTPWVEAAKAPTPTLEDYEIEDVKKPETQIIMESTTFEASQRVKGSEDPRKSETEIVIDPLFIQTATTQKPVQAAMSFSSFLEVDKQRYLEDFKPLIQDANNRLLKERTIFTPKLDENEEQEWKQNLLPNEVEDYDREKEPLKLYGNPYEHNINWSPYLHPATPVVDFTGKVLQEQDGVITEIEEKFRLNEFATDAGEKVTELPVADSKHATTAAASQEMSPAVSTKSLVKPPITVNHEIMQNNNNNNNHPHSPQHHPQTSSLLMPNIAVVRPVEFIERRVKKSFDFPMHRMASDATHTLQHFDFANTKFSSNINEPMQHLAAGNAGAVIGAAVNQGHETDAVHVPRPQPEFSTTKFYNSKELYNEMLQHKTKQQQQLHDKGSTSAMNLQHKDEVAMPSLALNSFAVLHSPKIAKLEELHELREPQKSLAIKRVTVQATKHKENANADSKDPAATGTNNSSSTTSTATTTTTSTTTTTTPATTASPTSTTKAPPVKKFHKELKKAKLLLKTIIPARQIIEDNINTIALGSAASSSLVSPTAIASTPDTSGGGGSDGTGQLTPTTSSSSSLLYSSNPQTLTTIKPLETYKPESRSNTLASSASATTSDSSSGAVISSSSLMSTTTKASTDDAPAAQPHATAPPSTTLSPVVATSRPTAAVSTNPTKSPLKPIVRPRILSRLQEKINSLECEIQNVPQDSHLWRGNETHELLLPIMIPENCKTDKDCTAMMVSWEGEAEIQSGDILIVEVNDALLNPKDVNLTTSAHNTQVYQVTRSGHEHCDVTEGILLDITPLIVDGRKLVTLYDKDLTEGVNLLIVVSELWGSQCVRLKVTTKTENCGENADCSGKGVCFSNTDMEEYECQCCSGFAGPHCEEIDACTPSPCTNNGICVDLSQGHEGNSYQCLCPYGYTGKNCQYELDPCNPAECMNGGSCVGNSTHFRCECSPGYTGPLCQHSLNECESSPCIHGICVDQEDGFRCFCQPGFAGELCNFEYNECESNPCQNGGECIDHIGSYECHCTKGYTGNRCHIKVDFCANKPCPEGRRCIDHGNDFSCECLGGRNGPDCNEMLRTQCNVNPCTHGGTCWSSGDSFYCACRPGYTGTMCEDEFVVETVVSSSEFMVDDTSARNFNDKSFGSSVVLKSPIELHNAYTAAIVLALVIFFVALYLTICHCKVNQTYRKFSTRTYGFLPIVGFRWRSKQATSKISRHWLSGKGLGVGNAMRASSSSSVGGGCGAANSLTSSQRNHVGHLPTANSSSSSSSHQQHHVGQLNERPFQRHLAMNLENDMYYTVDFSENSQHSPLIQ